MRWVIGLLLLIGLLGVACQQDAPSGQEPVVSGPALVMFYTDG